MRSISVAAVVVVLSWGCSSERVEDTPALEAGPELVVAREDTVVAVGEVGKQAWPDEFEVQLNVETLAFRPELRDLIPQCGKQVPSVTADSVGPFHAGQTLAEVLQACPAVYRAWDWGYEGIPSPVVVVRLGDAAVFAQLEDTALDSRVYHVSTADAATPEGLGSGSRLSELLAAYGQGRLVEGECVFGITFDTKPGLSFLLKWPEDEPVECGDLVMLVNQNAIDELPPGTTVRYLVQYGSGK